MSSPIPAPNQEHPWRMSDPLQERIARTAKGRGLSYKKCVVLPSDPEFDFVWNSFYSNKPSGWGIKGIYAIDHPSVVEGFESRLSIQQDEKDNPAFTPTDWSIGDPSGERGRILREWRDSSNRYTGFSLRNKTIDNASVLPLWHGSSVQKAKSICKTGFANIGGHDVKASIASGTVTDSGFFGKGIYFTSQARYAVEVYSKRSGVVLLAWVSMREPYPVKWEDFRGPLDGKNSLLGNTAPKDSYDAHYIPVIPRRPSNPFETTYVPLKPGENPQYHEFVVFQPFQTLPRFWVELQADLLSEPSIKISSTNELISFILILLAQSFVQEDERLKIAIKNKIQELLERSSDHLNGNDERFCERVFELVGNSGSGVCEDVREEIVQLFEVSAEPYKNKGNALVANLFSLLERNFAKDHQNGIPLAPDLSKIQSLLALPNPGPSEIQITLIEFLDSVLFNESVSEQELEKFKLKGSSADLELSLGRWFSHDKHLAVVDWQNRFKKLQIPALKCYGRALNLPSSQSQKVDIYREASRLLSNYLLDYLPNLKQSVKYEIIGRDFSSLTRLIYLLCKIRKYFYFEEEKERKLIAFYREIKNLLVQSRLDIAMGALDQISSQMGNASLTEISFEINLEPLSNSIISLENAINRANPLVDYLQSCSEALSSWKTTFEKEEALVLFSDLLIAVGPNIEKEKIEAFFSFLEASVPAKKSLECISLLKEFLFSRHKPQGGLSSLPLFAFEKIETMWMRPSRSFSHAAQELHQRNISLGEINDIYEKIKRISSNHLFEIQESYLRPFLRKISRVLMPNNEKVLLSLRPEGDFLTSIQKITKTEESKASIVVPFQGDRRCLRDDIINQLVNNWGVIEESRKNIVVEGLNFYFHQNPDTFLDSEELNRFTGMEVSLGLFWLRIGHSGGPVTSYPVLTAISSVRATA